MRWLVVDNHDSYTHNLVQLLAVASGTDPVVVSDDDVAPGELDLQGFAGVVVSPGPGHPANPRDFALSADVLARAQVPVLGVCLGMQGIALAAGAVVDAAPQPRHGFVDHVRHTGGSVLAGLPQGFDATRYHSFRVAEPLPDVLEPLAWAQDGVLMALRHRDRPQVGVQFHPESVASPSGALIVENFVRWCRRFGHPQRYTLHSRRVPGVVDAEAVVAGVLDGDDAFWLDSASRGAGSGRFSFLGPLTGPVETSMAAVSARLAGVGVDGAQAVPFEFAGGFVGWAGYEAKDECGFPVPHDGSRDPGTPANRWVFVDRFLALDHDEDATWVCALSEGAGDGDREPSWIGETLAALDGLAPVGEPAPTPDLPVVLDTAPERYRDDVVRAQEQLHAGESYEVCLTTRARVPVGPGPDAGFAAYRRLRRANPAPYAAYLRTGGVEVVGSSPERFLRVTQDGSVETRPIKGTASVDTDPAALQSDPKTRAENLIVVDLLRNDLGRVCVPGSVTVPHLMATETLATVHQLVTTVRGRLRPDVSAVDCLRACFPPGSMTGAPKLRTTEVIDALEQRPRGVYSGTLGWFSLTGAADLAVVIRTAVRVGEEWHVGAGGAVVLDSDPDAEVAEVLLKLRAPLAALTTRVAG